MIPSIVTDGLYWISSWCCNGNLMFVATFVYVFLQAGLRPICEFMTFNFSMQAIDQVRS